MSKIRAYVGYSERKNCRYYVDFKIVDMLPDVGDVKEFSPEREGTRTTVISVREKSVDCENDSDVFDYDFFRVVYSQEYLDDAGTWHYDGIDEEYIAIEREEETVDVEEN